MNANDCIPYWYPKLRLSDKQWCRVINALLSSPGQAERSLAWNLTRQIEDKRESALPVGEAAAS